MPETLGVTVVNLPRRADRRAWVAASVGLDAAPPGTALRFLAAVDGAAVASATAGGGLTLRHEGHTFEPVRGWALGADGLASLRARWAAALGCQPDATDLQQYFGRPVSAAELGCLASHHQAWREALAAGYERLLVLEDDVVAFPCAPLLGADGSIPPGQVQPPHPYCGPRFTVSGAGCDANAAVRPARRSSTTRAGPTSGGGSARRWRCWSRRRRRGSCCTSGGTSPRRSSHRSPPPPPFVLYGES
jgi:hypothetical protein